ncbi:putative LRR receptor-like serine/threonine-protein kinase [Camellia lanceoleosa]|uniref:LRR receptor-like serine/threonine-protein kinase n=1 Tax=Camellia lanceoleosa TaxID=1840588 RepID=A0ACC0HWB0_9ERIC|nr:putative LRR receptor-like serine/threonine-protein kinase [Camellia lanceoleosa]
MVDANAIILGGESLSNCSDKFVSVSEVIDEVSSDAEIEDHLQTQNNMLSNISGNASLPANVTVRLQGNLICLNTNLVLFCGPQNENETVSHIPSVTNSNGNCLVQSCPYEYAPNSPCFCAAPLIVGYRLKSPGFRYFEPYWVPFERYLTKGLKLNIFQLEIVSVLWEKGPQLRTDLKIFPVYVDNISFHIFNATEVQRIRSMFIGWHIPDSEIFGPYELLDFPLRFPYLDVIPSSTSKSGISKGALAGIVVGTVAGAVILSAVVSLLIWRLHMNKYTAVSKRRRCVKSILDPCEDENDDIQDDDVSLGADFVQRDEHSESVSEISSRIVMIMDDMVNEGKRVIHYDLTEKKLMEVKKVLDIDAMDLDMNESHNKSNHIEFQKMGINRDMSTCGMLHSIGSDLTHTWGKSETHQNGSIRSMQNRLRARDYGNTPTSRAEVSLSSPELLPFYL